jgi:hypothetical protein
VKVQIRVENKDAEFQLVKLDLKKPIMFECKWPMTQNSTIIPLSALTACCYKNCQTLRQKWGSHWTRWRSEKVWCAMEQLVLLTGKNKSLGLQ